MSNPRFMSREHVDVINSLLAADPGIHAKCAALDRDYALGYTITDDPEGITDWAVRIEPTGVRFEVNTGVEGADLLYSGSYPEICASTLAAREGRETDGGFTFVHGDEVAAAVIVEFVAEAQRVAVVPVDFPGGGSHA